MAAAVIPDEATCVGCNYPLRGLSDMRCPECGREFDPGRPLTMNLGRPLGRFAKSAVKPMGRKARAVVWGLAIAGIVGPGWLIPADTVAVLWLLLWLAFFVALWRRSFVRWVVVRRYHQPRILLRLDRRFTWTARLAFVLSTVLVVSRAPFVVAILVSRPWLDAYAQHLWAEIPATQPFPKGPVLRGAVVIQSVSSGGYGVTFHCYGGEIRYVQTMDGQGLRIDGLSWNPRWNFRRW